MSNPWTLSDFDFDLPDDRIARYPLSERGASRLLHVCPQGWTDRMFCQLPALLKRGDLLVFNNTRVLPARLWAHKSSGGRVEMLLERMLNQGEALFHVRASKPCRPGTRLLLADGRETTVLGRQEDLWRVHSEHSWREILYSMGEMPLPPYLGRSAEDLDRVRYQTVYARHEGSVAAPTAGLHFDQAMLDALSNQGIEQAEITLHVGAGTFQPVRTEQIDDHVMHQEWMQVNAEVVGAIESCQRRGGRVVAVGSTSARALETAASSGVLKTFDGDSQIFIRPGYNWQVVDAMITNFHLPRSTLMMMVCALVGHELLMSAYRHAVADGYRFFSYGDACFLERGAGR